MQVFDLESLLKEETKELEALKETNANFMTMVCRVEKRGCASQLWSESVVEGRHENQLLLTLFIRSLLPPPLRLTMRQPQTPTHPQLHMRSDAWRGCYAGRGPPGGRECR